MCYILNLLLLLPEISCFVHNKVTGKAWTTQDSMSPKIINPRSDLRITDTCRVVRFDGFIIVWGWGWLNTAVLVIHFSINFMPFFSFLLLFYEFSQKFKRFNLLCLSPSFSNLPHTVLELFLGPISLIWLFFDFVINWKSKLDIWYVI